jgi:hypothetical protein
MKDDNDSAGKDGRKGALVAYWFRKLDREEKAHEKFRRAAKKAEQAYFDEREDGLKNLFPIFWSNVNTLHSAMYQHNPKPDVRPRYAFEGPQAVIAKQAAQLVERGLEYIVDTTDFSTSADRVIDDFLVTALGVPWVEYDAKVNRDEQGEPTEIALQTVRMVHKPWSRFHWEPGKDWSDVDWIACDDYLTASEIKEQFGKEPTGEGTRKRERTEADKYATTFRVVSIYHRPKRTVYVVCEDFEDPLEVRRDKLNLQDFYPCPLPLLSNVKSDDLTPKPEYAFYEAQCDYINRITQRIHNITAQLKVAGLYDAQLGELANLANADDGTLIPVQNLLERLNSAGGSASFDQVVAQLPLQDKASVLVQLYDLREKAKAEVYEITGISDIVRGVTVASETASAQQQKGQWAQVRIARRKRQVNDALRGVFRIMAEIMAEHFTPESWLLATGIQPDPQVLGAIKTDLGRTLLIDVETDSTVAMDDQDEQAQRLTMLKEVTPFMQGILPMVQKGLIPADLAKEMLVTALDGFKHGKSLMDVVANLPNSQQQMQQMQQQLRQAQQQGQQLQQQLEQAMAQVQQLSGQKAQLDQAKVQGDIAATQADSQAKQATAAANIQLTQAKTAATVAGAQAKAMQGPFIP